MYESFWGGKKLCEYEISTQILRVHPYQLTRSESWRAENASARTRVPGELLEEIRSGKRLRLAMRYLEFPKQS